MARCTATPPCNYKLNGEVHDFGCAARADYHDGDLGHLYATETAIERVILDAALDGLLASADLAGEFDADEVEGSDADWLILRARIRAGHAPMDVADGFALRVEGCVPSLVNASASLPDRAAFLPARLLAS